MAPVGAVDFEHIGDHRAENPQQKNESNAFGVVATPHGAFAANAAAGSLDLFSNWGDVQFVHYFRFHPPGGGFPSDEVPTCLVRANRHIWIGDLDNRRPSLPKTGSSVRYHIERGRGSVVTSDLNFPNMWLSQKEGWP